ncbi:MAG: N-acetylmuramoyl-L-alanine amidase family protein [Bulleidia sp.]
MLNRKTLQTAVAVFSLTIGTETIVNVNAEKAEEITAEKTDHLFYRASNLLEAKLNTIDPLNPDRLTGLQNINGTFYYFNEDGTLHTGWMHFGDNTVYYAQDGSFTTGLETLVDEEGNEGVYYFDDNGLLTTGWQTVEGKKYYFHGDGKAETGTRKEGDTIYTFNDEGEMVESHQEVKQEPVQAAPAVSYKPAGTAVQSDMAQVSSPPVSQPAPEPVPVPAPVDDGALGTLMIGGYSARVFAGGVNNAVNQPIVDAPNSAVLMNYLGRQMIADHAHQGFSVLRSCGVGSVGSFCGSTIVCASSYQGVNTGNGIKLNDGRWADEVYDGTYIMYTCNDAGGTSVTVTFWN